MLREVLHQAGGVQVLDGWSITQAQVDGKGGGEVLRQENASFGSTVKPVRKAKNFLQVISFIICYEGTVPVKGWFSIFLLSIEAAP